MFAAALMIREPSSWDRDRSEEEEEDDDDDATSVDVSSLQFIVMVWERNEMEKTRKIEAKRVVQRDKERQMDR